MSKSEEKLVDLAAPFLRYGEHARAAVYAAPYGWPQGASRSGNAGAMLVLEMLNKKKKRQTLEAAASVGFHLKSPVGLILTDSRVMCVELGSGLRTKVLGLLGEAPLHEVTLDQVKRRGLGKRLSVTVTGTQFLLDIPPASDVAVFLNEFERAKAQLAG